MMKVNDFQKYEVTLTIPYESYFSLIYETKYLLEARLCPNRCFVAHHLVYACSRRKAVEKAAAWYNKELKEALGAPHLFMTIDDPMNEVIYDEGFVCSDLRNKYLNEVTRTRLIEEAQGDLAADDSKGSECHPPCSVKRIRRRKKEHVQLSSRLSQTAGGTIYYRMTEMPESKGGRPKIRMVRLSSKSLKKAEKEVARRGLDKFEKFSTGESEQPIPPDQQAA